MLAAQLLRLKMHDNSIKLLNLMFLPGETICVSPGKYGYHSVPLENVIEGPVTLVPPSTDSSIKTVPSTSIVLIALNPISGFRADNNCTAFRNFLIEMDFGPLSEQMAYIKRIGMPYSAVVFSGGKSLHFLVSLDEDLPSQKIYRYFSSWLLGIATMSDQNCQNPSRSIRMPEVERDTGKAQRLVEYKGKVKISDLVNWLNSHPGAKPRPPKPRLVGTKATFARLPHWTKRQLTKGLDTEKGRNKGWFAIACDFAIAGYSEDDTINILSDYFTPDHDFKEREWLTSIRSGFKYIYDRKR